MSVLEHDGVSGDGPIAAALHRDNDGPFSTPCGGRNGCSAIVEVTPKDDLTWDILKGDVEGHEFLSLGWQCPTCQLRHNTMAFNAEVYLYYRSQGVNKNLAVLGAIGHVFEGDWVTYSAELYVSRASAWSGYVGVDC